MSQRRTAVAAAALVLVATLAIGQERELQDATRSKGFAGGPYELTGKVMVVDRASGRLSIDSDGKWLQLSVPTAQLSGIRTGDRVTVSYELRDDGHVVFTPGSDEMLRGHR
jgi:hypothetical protein